MRIVKPVFFSHIQITYSDLRKGMKNRIAPLEQELNDQNYHKYLAFDAK